MNGYRKIIACFKEIGFRPAVDEFEDRLRVQKMVYLLQLRGVKLGFDYGLHIRGPYCRNLADALYEHRREFEALSTDVTLNAAEARAAEELKELFGIQTILLEVAATYAYCFKESGDAWSAHQQVKAIKRNLPELKIIIGVNKAKEYLFRPSAAQIAKMKDEFRAWESTPNKELD